MTDVVVATGTPVAVAVAAEESVGAAKGADVRAATNAALTSDRTVAGELSSMAGDAFSSELRAAAQKTRAILDATLAASANLKASVDLARCIHGEMTVWSGRSTNKKNLCALIAAHARDDLVAALGAFEHQYKSYKKVSAPSLSPLETPNRSMSPPW